MDGSMDLTSHGHPDGLKKAEREYYPEGYLPVRH
jgi:hypothetical protein